jgi:outer membrane protein OmpA-like peptidoglycan-associated protein
MRQLCLGLLVLVGFAAPALAQVTVDLQALDALPGAKPAEKAPPARRPPARPAPHRVTTAKPKPPPVEAAPAGPPSVATTQPGSAAPVAPPAPGAPPAPPPATLPAAPPPNVALAPIVPPQAPAPVAPPPPPPISEGAASAAVAIGAGLRVTFGSGQTDLSPASAAAIKSVVQSAPPGDSTSFNVVAYAAGTPEDPSTARRLSLSRALAVRSALMADGVNSSRIYVRALGAPASGDDTPDRVELSVMGGNAAAPAATGAKSQPQ